MLATEIWLCSRQVKHFELERRYWKVPASDFKLLSYITIFNGLFDLAFVRVKNHHFLQPFICHIYWRSYAIASFLIVDKWNTQTCDVTITACIPNIVASISRQSSAASLRAYGINYGCISWTHLCVDFVRLQRTYNTCFNGNSSWRRSLEMRMSFQHMMCCHDRSAIVLSYCLTAIQCKVYQSSFIKLIHCRC